MDFGRRNCIAVVGNSVRGNMTAALALMAEDRNGPEISYQVLLWPATNAGVYLFLREIRKQIAF